MIFGGINYTAVVLAAIAAFVLGAVYYISLSKPWMKPARIDPLKANRSIAPFVTSFVAELVMAYVLAGLIGHLGPDQFNLRNGMISGLFVWAGFMVTTMAVNHRYEGFGWALTLIDGVHWLLVALLMGAIIGAMGV